MNVNGLGIASAAGLWLGAGAAALGQSAPEPNWPVECSEAATPARHLRCDRSANGFDMRTLYGPIREGGEAPTMIQNNPSVALNTEDHFTWRVQTGYAYLKASAARNKERGVTGRPGAQDARPRAPIEVKALSYWRSLRSTRSLLSSPGSVMITQLVEPAERSGNQWVRARCFLLDELDAEVHRATCRRIVDGVVQQTRMLAEGEYIEFYSADEGTSVWRLGEPAAIAGLAEDAPARKFLDWVWRNADEQRLEPPRLPWQDVAPEP
ncbi:MAG: hypothetical protein IT436_05885 [Phycisphaerales bacterium]|nr:hypothetical protein [Phycisphaerales bacterium]